MQQEKLNVNVHLDPELSLRQVHEICDKIENEIGSRIKRSEVNIHAEPQDLWHIQSEKQDGL